ncbi:biopolymer transporter Tol [Microbacterium deminutum]
MILESELLLEAPNWTPDRGTLIVNAEGGLYQLSLESGRLEALDISGVADVNNDHVLSPDGESIFFSAAGHLYGVSVHGGEVRKVSNDHGDEHPYSYWLHGISPDGETLVYVAVEPYNGDARGRRNLAIISSVGGLDAYLTDGLIGFDGPEYSPDGHWIYYNSEEAAARPGHSQIFRMRPDGSDHQQLTFDDRVNWFPHLNPAGDMLAYISYEPGSLGHPADVDVVLKLMPASGGRPHDAVRLFGGQGTMNVNSWSPDGSQFAFVAYPAKSQ